MDGNSRSKSPGSHQQTAAQLVLQHVKHQFLLGCTFAITSYERNEVEFYKTLLKKLGAFVSPMYKSTCTHLLTSYQEGEAYSQAVRDEKVIVTSQWLEDCVAMQGVVPIYLDNDTASCDAKVKLSRLANPIYYPLGSRDGIPQMKQLMLSVSGFAQKDKRRLQYLILATGASYTKDLTKQNTHLIYKQPSGEKYEMAGKWGMKRVAKEWLYECVTRWTHIPEVGFENFSGETLSNRSPQRAESSRKQTRRRVEVDFDDPGESELLPKRQKILSPEAKQKYLILRGDALDLKTYCEQIQARDGVIYMVDRTNIDQEYKQDVEQFVKGENSIEQAIALFSQQHPPDNNRITPHSEEPIFQLFQAERPFHTVMISDLIGENPSQPIHMIVPLHSGNPTPPIEIQHASAPITGVVYDPRMCLHDGAYPESPVRLSAIFTTLQEKRLIDKCKVMLSYEATFEELCLCHDRDYVQRFFDGTYQHQRKENACSSAMEHDNEHDPHTDDIQINSHTLKASLLAAGGVIKMTKKVCSGSIQNGFSIVRPPGHHAKKNEAMGFCIFNNVAIAARYAQQNFAAIKKVLIVDFDIHHGNGTQDIFEDDPSVLYMSIHRYENGFYPGTGSMEEVGRGKGKGTIVNIPLPPPGFSSPNLSALTFNDADYAFIFHYVMLPIAQEFNPDLVLVSAGFDAVKGDILGRNKMVLSPKGFAQMVQSLKSLAGGKLVLALEGGYRLDRTAFCSSACLRVLLGEDILLIGPSPKQPSAATFAAVRQAIQIQSPYWKSMQNLADTFMMNSSPPTPSLPMQIPSNHSNKLQYEDGIVSPPSLFGSPIEKKNHVIVDLDSEINSITYAIQHVKDMLHCDTKDNPTYYIELRQGIYEEKILIESMPCKLIILAEGYIEIDHTTHRKATSIIEGTSDLVTIIGNVGTIEFRGVCFRNSSMKHQNNLEDCKFIARNTTVDSLHLKDCLLYGIGVDVEIDSGITMVNNEISHTRSNAITVCERSSVKLDSNFICFNENGVFCHNASVVELVRNVVERNTKIGIACVNTSGLIEENHIAFNRHSGIQLSDGDVIIRKNKVNRQEQAGIALYNSNQSTVEHNEITENGYAGIEISSTGSPIIRNNRIHHGKQSGILIINGCNSLVEGNDIFDNLFAGIEVSSGNPVIARNSIYRQLQAGISLHGSETVCQVEENIISENIFAGIEIKDKASPLIRLNKIHHGKQNGVSVFEGATGTLDSNEIFENQCAGLHVKSDANPLVTKNRIHHNKGCGIVISEQGQGIFLENEIYDNTDFGVNIATLGTSCQLTRNVIRDHVEFGIVATNSSAGTLTANDLRENKSPQISISQDCDFKIQHNSAAQEES